MTDQDSDWSKFTAVSGVRALSFPRSFGKYEYVDTISTGFSAVVILVRDIITSIPYACKVVSRQFLTDNDLLDKFESELRFMETMRHRNVVQFEEVVFLPEFICIVMEYCSGGDLRSHIIKTGALSEGQACTLFTQLVEAVNYIHSHNICHRDIKPQNILLDGHFNVKLCDFGFCCAQLSNALLTSHCGSLFYAAPEIVSHKQYNGKKADIWAMGVLLYAMCSGNMPWSSGDVIQLFSEIQNDDIITPHFFSSALTKLIAGMLDRSPERRFRIEDVASSDWIVGKNIFKGDEMKCATSGRWKEGLTVKRQVPGRNSLDVIRARPVRLFTLLKRPL
jgi:serine/threonine protein kinase